MKKRLEFLDIAKGLAIILMVLGHSSSEGGVQLSNFVNLFHMAVFIFISGYLFKDRLFNTFKDLKNYLFQRIKKLYLFYLKYELLFLLLTNFFLAINFYNVNFTYGGKVIAPISSLTMLLKKVFYIIIGMGREPFCGAFWFIISLIFIIFGYSIIKYISRKQKIINSKIFEKIAIITCFVIGFLMQKYFNIQRAAPAFTLMLIYDLGNEAYIHRDKIKFNNIFLGIVCFIGLIILNNFGYISINHNNYSNPIYFIVCSILGVYFILSLANFISNHLKTIAKVLKYIGQNTLSIMAWHYIGFKIAMLIQFSICHIDFINLATLGGYQNYNLWWILYIICGVSFPCLLNYIYNYLKKITKYIKKFQND